MALSRLFFYKEVFLPPIWIGFQTVLRVIIVPGKAKLLPIYPQTLLIAIYFEAKLREAIFIETAFVFVSLFSL